jgi:hypothetical protein
MFVCVCVCGWRVLPLIPSRIKTVDESACLNNFAFITNSFQRILYRMDSRKGTLFLSVINKSFRFSEHVSSQNTCAVYSNHSEWINSGWTKGITENVNRFYLGLRWWKHCGRRRNLILLTDRKVSQTARYFCTYITFTPYICGCLSAKQGTKHPAMVDVLRNRWLTSVRDILVGAWIWIRFPTNVIGIEQNTTAIGRLWRLVGWVEL